MTISFVYTLELSRILKKNTKGTLMHGFSPNAFTVDLDMTRLCFHFSHLIHCHQCYRERETGVAGRRWGLRVAVCDAVSTHHHTTSGSVSAS